MSFCDLFFRGVGDGKLVVRAGACCVRKSARGAVFFVVLFLSFCCVFLLFTSVVSYPVTMANCVCLGASVVPNPEWANCVPVCFAPSPLRARPLRVNDFS